MQNSEIAKVNITRFDALNHGQREDALAVEEPLEISIFYFNGIEFTKKNISITMRTPGKDKELAIGFLFTEGIIKSTEAIENVFVDAENSICIQMQKKAVLDLSKIERHFYTSSSCGVCGKSSIESLKTVKEEHIIQDDFTIPPETIYSLNQKVKQEQAVFESTGGLHASAIFNQEGKIQGLFEDVGRHNALDKLIGSAFMNGNLPLQSSVLFLSGRACYELIQKAAMAGIPVICALGAPSSLAVELAIEFNITLIGFLKEKSFNVYSHGERILS